MWGEWVEWCGMEWCGMEWCGGWSDVEKCGGVG